MTNIIQRIAQIEDEFYFLDEWEERYRHIIDCANNLEKLDDAEKIDENIIRGCTSRVWMVHKYDDGHILLKGESDSSLVQGLIAIIVRIYSNSTPNEIISNPPIEILGNLGFYEALTPNRANGLKSMANKILEIARHYI